MYIYHALINALSAHMIHINLTVSTLNKMKNKKKFWNRNNCIVVHKMTKLSGFSYHNQFVDVQKLHCDRC